MSYITKKDIDEYYSVIGLDAFFPSNIFEALFALKSRKKGILITNSRIIRGLGRICGMPRVSWNTCISSVEDYFAFRDALKVLSKKNIPVFFYNRVGLKKEGFSYKESAIERITKGLSFPKMATNFTFYEGHLREVLGEDYNKDFLINLQKISQIVKKGNIYSHEDCQTELVNVINGKRITLYTPEKTKRRLHIYGRCGAFGYAVSDEQTLASQIQKLLSNSEIEVINHGLWGGEDRHILHNFFNELSGFNDDDIVIFYMKHFDKQLQWVYAGLGMYYKEVTEEWHKYDESRWCFYDKPGHMNAIGYKNLAKLIVDDLLEKKFLPKGIPGESVVHLDAKYLNSYLKEHKDVAFEKEVHQYVDSISKTVPILPSDKVVGSIVMNCNPFTKGHRYLIEFAATKVDRLFIFVVEEDKSLFKFKDRFEMVEEGTKDINNVIVVPSGSFIISTLTFPEYFLKDYVKEKDFDVSQDLETFCSMIAKPLNIQIRFAGEEPFDPVTKNYNESMRRILPLYGMKFMEVPRLRLEGTAEQINATRVRQLLKEKNVDELKKYVPNTTMDILLERYFK